MFSSFTWEQFCFVVTLLLLAWYAGVLLYYRPPRIAGLTAIVQQQPGRESPPKAREEANKTVSELPPILGKTKLPEGVSLVAPSELSFYTPSDADSYDQIGLVPDLLEDLKDVFKGLPAADGQKRDFLKSMVEIREVYPGMRSHPQLKAINEFIVQQAPFALSPGELDDLWD